MAKKNPTKSTRIIDPTFFIPVGVEDWEYDQDALGSESDDELDYELTDEPDEPEQLVPPGTFIVVSQSIRKKRNGDEVVDIVVEVEDIPGAEDYELRVTKA